VLSAVLGVSTLAVSAAAAAAALSSLPGIAFGLDHMGFLTAMQAVRRQSEPHSDA
jgi:hypothetical protein